MRHLPYGAAVDERRRTVVLGLVAGLVLAVGVALRWDDREDPWPWAGEWIAFAAVVAVVAVGLALTGRRRNRDPGPDR